MKPLSEYLDDEMIQQLKNEIRAGSFPKISFEHAMQFILTDGILPRSGLPALSFIKLEDWIRTTDQKHIVTYTTTALKNHTGRILDQVLEGKTVQLVKHGRRIAEIKKIGS